MQKNKEIRSQLGLVIKIIFLVMIFSTGCESIKRRNQAHSDMNSQILQGFSQENSGAEKKSESEGSEVTNRAQKNTQLKRPKVGLILGPGGIHSFAHMGLLKALNEAKIPIDHIVGIEWGALIGGLYATNQKLHKIEWDIYKLKDSDFPQEGFFSKKLDGIDLSQILSHFDWKPEGFELPFACPSQSIYQSQLVWQDSFDIKERLKKCMSFPPANSEEQIWVSEPFSLRDSISYLKKKGVELIIVSNVLTTEKMLEPKVIKANVSASILWKNLSRYYQDLLKVDHLNKLGYNHIWVVRVPILGQHIYEYSQRKTLALKGFRASEPVIERIVEEYGF